MGVDVVTVDVSPEMLELYKRKASAAGLRSTTQVGEIGSFLSTSTEEWDLVVFSSALHHLDDYRAILDAVCGRLAEGGVIATVFDPISLGKLVQAIRYIDYLGWLAVRQPLSFLRKLGQRAARPSVGSTSIGRLAERHALTGIDDTALARHFEANGLEIVLHERSYEARFAAMRGVLRLLASPTAFAFVVRRTA
jgi:SAM-dependent methyltransferase